jgi:cold shock CspA family protein
MMHGTIQRVRADRGFGFLRGSGELYDRFFHASALRGVDLTELTPGQRVLFEHEDNLKGPRATQISLAP